MKKFPPGFTKKKIMRLGDRLVKQRTSTAISMEQNPLWTFLKMKKELQQQERWKSLSIWKETFEPVAKMMINQLPDTLMPPLSEIPDLKKIYNNKTDTLVYRYYGFANGCGEEYITLEMVKIAVSKKAFRFALSTEVE